MITYICSICNKPLEYRFIFNEECKPVAQATGGSFRIVEIQRVNIRGVIIEDTIGICDECFKNVKEIAEKQGKKAKHEK